jgi:hypothetical protein
MKFGFEPAKRQRNARIRAAIERRMGIMGRSRILGNIVDCLLSEGLRGNRL